MKNRKLGRYSLIEELGSGGFGKVYKATDTLGRTVALKVLKPGLSADPAAIARFRHEAQAASRLFHQRIATVIDFDQHEAFAFLVMRYVDGPSLDTLLEEKGHLSWQESLQIFSEIAEGLAFAHRRGFIHRDLKPANILVSPEEGAVLVDFGLVKAAAVSGLTSMKVLLGMMHYVPPEMWAGQEPTSASDVYSLACVLFEMLSGRNLFPAKTIPEIIQKQTVEGPKLPEDWAADVPIGVKALLETALSKEPAERPSIEEFRSRLLSLDKLPQVVFVDPQAPTRASFPSIRKMLIEPEMIAVPSGPFQMGAGEDLHEVSLPGYSIGKFPVTNAQYHLFVQAAQYREPRLWDKGKPPESKLNHPVVNVSWKDALAYCRWLVQETGKAYFLPSEAEWEKAARGLLDARRYPWGDEFDTALANTEETGLGDTSPVGQYSPQGDSPYGCVDMSGNTWEWTLSKWGRELGAPDYGYPYDPADGREDLDGSVLRVLRGGSFLGDQQHARVAFRLGAVPDLRLKFHGFRVVLKSK